MPDVPHAAWFGSEGGDIGRAVDCTLVLADPERHISRHHASVQCREGRYYLRLQSAGLPVEVEGRVLHVDDEAELQAGHRITIGAYRLEVLDEPDSLGLPTDPARRERTGTAWRVADLADHYGFTDIDGRVPRKS